MKNLWKLVSSPRHLLVFEAAARLLSFTKAAQELNVSQPAISAGIADLERALGVTLFQRAHRKISLTIAGERLYSDVSAGFARILSGAEAVTTMGQRNYVTLSASTAFANYWMMPRLAQLHRAHPDVDLRLQTSDREPDIEAEGISLAIRRGDGHWEGCEAALIAPEVIFPVAAPRVMAAAIHLHTITNLPHQNLIHLEEPVRERPSWSDYFAAFDMPVEAPKGGLRLNDYALVLQAAMAGEGFAFGWEHVTRNLIDMGLLAARPEWSWRTGHGFYLVWSKNRALSPQAEQVREWLMQFAAEN